MFDKRLTLIVWAITLGLSADSAFPKETQRSGAPAQVEEADLCEPVLNFNLLTMHMGDEFPFKRVRRLEFTENRARYVKLGKGGTATVLRVFPFGDLPSYIQKEYRIKLNRDNDIDAFEILRRQPRPQGVVLVDPVAIGELTTQMRDVKGKTLETVLEENEVSELEKKNLVERWNSYVRDMESRLSGSAIDYELRQHGRILSLSCTILYHGQEIEIFLKGDNVIVEEKSGHLVIVDPY